MNRERVSFHLAGRFRVEYGEQRIGADEFPGQQGRLAFAFLLLERGRPVSRQELAAVLWPSRMPAAWDSALSAVISKLRTLLAELGPGWTDCLQGARGSYELRCPVLPSVDVEVAMAELHEGEIAMRRGDFASAFGPTAVAMTIASRPFFPGEDSSWVERRRDRLRDCHLRALEARAAIYLWNNEPVYALQNGKEVIALEPFRESGYRLIMQAHVKMGNTAEALRTYEQCRRLIADELGVDPSPDTKALHEQVLRLV